MQDILKSTRNTINFKSGGLYNDHRQSDRQRGSNIAVSSLMIAVKPKHVAAK